MKMIIFLFWTEIFKIYFKCTVFDIFNKLLVNGLKFYLNLRIVNLILLKKLLLILLKNKNFKELKIFLKKITVCFFVNSKNSQNINIKFMSNLVIDSYYYSYYLINICSMINSHFIICKIFEKLLKKHCFSYPILRVYTQYLKNNDFVSKSLLVRFKIIKHIKNMDKKVFWFDIIRDISIKKKIDPDKDLYFVEKEIFQNDFFDQESLFIILLLFITKTSTFNKILQLTKKIFLHKNFNFNHLLYLLKLISNYYGANQLIEILKYTWVNFFCLRFKKRDLVKMCFLLIFINEFLGNFYISRQILYSICNTFKLSTNNNIYKIYKNFEILHGNEESFRDYLIGKNNLKK
uniref:Uncharacterized protein n=2 Tax=Lotharella oceanica TaxID=641309 RepID=A0A7S2TTY1_9EUKA|mmetsp:Transcript_27313/g.50996  ORF Transcript_27313/g.50996 Transcript_27313/m.50996 type:complete len:348 (+) Transcript_27313:174-1217(+)